MRSVSLRLRSWLRRREVERDLDEELAYHLTQLTSAHAAAGLSPRAARAAAVRQLGGVARAKEAVRDTWHVRLLDQCRQDARVALRGMRRTPSATLIMLMTLAISIGASTAVFSLVNGVLLRAPYPDADRIVWLMSTTPRGERSAVSAPDYRDWQHDNEVFESLSSWGFGTVTLSDDVAPLPLRTTFASASYFSVLGMRPELGRVFQRDEEVAGRDRVAIVSHRLWTSRFQSDPGIVGRTIRVRGEPHTIVGVLPESASRGEWAWTEIWLPHVISPEAQAREYRSFNVYGRIRAGVPLEQARASMTALAARLGQAYPASNRGWGIELAPYREVQANPAMRQSLYLLMAAVAAVLLIGCVNLANILLARSLARERESSIRAALGGGRARLLRQFATESVLLSLIGGGLGLLVAQGLLAIVRRGLPAFASANAGLPPQGVIVMDGRVLAFAVAVSLATSLLFGALPARAATRIDLASAMKERQGSAEGSGGARRILVVAEVALAFVLLTSAGLMIESFARLRDQESGFESRNVLTASLPLVAEQTSGPADARRAYISEILERVARVPGVRRAALTSALPLRGWGAELPCQPGDLSIDRASRPQCFFKMVSPGYFDTLGLRLRAGRGFTEQDEVAGAKVAVINETLARKYFAGRDPIGGRVAIPEVSASGRAVLGADIAWQVIGVVADERVSPLNQPRESPGLYVSMAQNPPRRPALVLRTELSPAAVERSIRQAVAGINPDQPLADVRTLDDIKAESLGSDRQRAVVLTAFALVALLMACTGIYGVLSYMITQRTRELGVRAAIGARRSDLFRLVLKDGLAFAALGLLVGLVAIAGLSRVWGGLLFGVGALDMTSVVQAGVLLLVVAAAASVLPARRAVTIDPLTALRYE